MRRRRRRGGGRLVALSVVRTFELPSKNPAFLCFDAAGDVLVAPCSRATTRERGERPTTSSDPQHRGPTVLDFTTIALNGTRLPDEDLFRCIRATGTVQPVTRDVGTIQFAVGVHPGTGEVWQLNTEGLNKGPGAAGFSRHRR